MTTDEILAERGKRYGAFREHARISQALKGLMTTGRSFEALSASQHEALEMIQHKVARILNGDPGYADSWRDIAGYATLVADELEGAVR